MLKILIAPASYKGSIAAHILAEAMERGCRELLLGDMHHLYGDFEIVKAPIADGGDDTLVAVHQVLGGKLMSSQVTGPTGLAVTAQYLQLGEEEGGLAIVELAQASGIAHLQQNQLRPLTAHTYGTGQLISRAIAGGAKKVVIMIGGSASTDGGTGALSAMGAKFLDSEGRAVTLGGGGLLQIVRIDISELLRTSTGVEFVVATDVVSPLSGEAGAAAVFAPQKGANAADVILLDQGLAHLASLVEGQLSERLSQATGRSVGSFSDLARLPGAGAAGGAGFGFAAMLGAEIVSGFHYLSQLLGLEQKIAWCDLVIVAEGRLDRQSLSGKGVGEVIQMAAQMGKTVLALPALSALDEADLVGLAACDPGKILVWPTAAAGEKSRPAEAADVQSAAKAALAIAIKRLI